MGQRSQRRRQVRPRPTQVSRSPGAAHRSTVELGLSVRRRRQARQPSASRLPVGRAAASLPRRSPGQSETSPPFAARSVGLQIGQDCSAPDRVTAIASTNGAKSVWSSPSSASVLQWYRLPLFAWTSKPRRSPTPPPPSRAAVPTQQRSGDRARPISTVRAPAPLQRPSRMWDGRIGFEIAVGNEPGEASHRLGTRLRHGPFPPPVAQIERGGAKNESRSSPVTVSNTPRSLLAA